MAINIPIITSLEDTGIKNAKAAFGDFKAAVSKAEGGMGKFKAGANVALDSVKANAGKLALAGGAALVGFAKAGIDAFNDLALSSGKFADATGLAVEEASRWIEVAGDIGIESNYVEDSIGKMNKVLGTSPDLFKQLGIEIATTDGHTTDVNGTFLNVIDKLKGIEDPAEKAKVATQLLGRGWQDMAELINIGSTNLKNSLDGVSESKTISSTELGKAKDYRAAMDNLKDTMEDLSITLGQNLLPAITKIIENLLPVVELGTSFVDSFVGLDKLSVKLYNAGDSIESIVEFLGGARVAAELNLTPLELLALAGTETGDAFLYLTEQGRIYTEYTQSRIKAINGTTDAIEDQGEEISITDLKWQALKGTLELDSAMADAREQLDRLAEKAIEAFNGADGALSEYEQGLIDAKLKVLQLGESIALTDSQKNQIRVLVDTGQLEQALTLIDRISSGGRVSLVEENRFARRANGGPVNFGNSYIVGERGPELFTPSSSGNITPNHAMGGGSTITVNVNGGDPDAVVRAIQKYARQNGAIPLQTTTSARF
jgi:hypothetical protein